MKTINIYGWNPDLPDRRDYLLTVTHRAALPTKVDLRKLCSGVYDQGELGSCTANAIAAAYDFVQNKQLSQGFIFPSRLFIYYNERVMEDSVDEDSGAQIRDGIKSIHKQGVCTEYLCPYKIDYFTIKPKVEDYANAKLHLLEEYLRLDNRSLRGLKSCLAQGFPFVFGFSVYEDFESDRVARTGKVNMPKSSEQLLGGHAVMAVGYDDKKKVFIVRNSWGTEWGMKGYFTMPYDYLTTTDLADDFWTLRGTS